MNAWLRWGCAALLVAGCRDPEVSADPTDSTTGSTTDATIGDDDLDGGSGASSDDGSDDDGPLEPSAVPEPRAGRLTHLQYAYTVLDVLGVALTEEELDQLPTDIPTGRDYSTTIDLQFFNSNYALAYALIARSVSERLEPAELVSEFGDCAPLDPSCRASFLEALGLRMFRRPLTEEELSRYLEVADTIAQPAETTEDDVVRGLVQLLMQAPAFLYRIEAETDGEPGTLRSIDGYELATRLSYFLWQSAPDEPLLHFAAGPAGDGVYDPALLDTHIERMISDPRFARSLALFWGDYTLASRSGFATADEQLAAELRDSIMATLERISGMDGDPEPLSALFDGQQIVMTPAVAELAGATPAGEGLQVYDVADATERLGVVTHPAFLSSIGTTSFVGRGLFLTERLLCQHVTEPPAEVADEIENTAQATEDMTPREASEYRMGLEPVCLGCHTQFEPVAYAFERYDLNGRFTLTDEEGRDLYSDGSLPAFGERPPIEFDDARGLLTELATVDAVYACLVENMTAFGTGQRALLAGPFDEIATDQFIGEGLTFEALVRAVAGNEQRTLSRVVAP